jgi:nucleoside-specific outer membrane channel protein Tsx
VSSLARTRNATNRRAANLPKPELETLMMKNLLARSGAVLLAAASLAPACQAAEVFQNTDLILGYTTQAKPDAVFGTGTSDKKETSLRFEHFGVHGFGDNYFFVDDINGKQVGGPTAGSFNFDTKHQYVLVWNARASLSKLTGSKMSFGPVDDVSLMYRLERASYANYSANMIGPSFNLKLPGFAWFQTSFLLNKQDHSFAAADDKKAHLFWHTFAILPFEAGGAKFTFSPLLWVNFAKGGTGTETYIEPDLWVKLGDSPVELGFRAQYHKYDNYSRTTPTLMAKWNF